MKFSGKGQGILVLCFCFSSFFLTVKGWSPAAHLIIAQLSYSQLTEVAKANVNASLIGFSNFYPNFSTIPAASLWADILQYKSDHFFNHWHYIDYPIVIGSSTIKQKSPSEENIVWALYRCFKTLSGSGNDLWSKEFALRFFIHLIGEIHQPLSCVNFYSKNFPKGNRGAKLLKLKNSILYDTKFLFDFWDQGAGLLDEIKIFGNLNQSLTSFDFEISDILTFIQVLNLEWTIDNFNISMIESQNFTHWAVYSNFIAKKNIFYGSVKSSINHLHLNIDEEYIAHAQSLVKYQIALASFRLSSILNKLFTKMPSINQHLQNRTSIQSLNSDDASSCSPSPSSPSSSFSSSSFNTFLILLLSTLSLTLFLLLLKERNNTQHSSVPNELELSASGKVNIHTKPKTNFTKLWNKRGNLPAKFFSKPYQKIRIQPSANDYVASSSLGGSLHALDDEDEDEFLFGDDERVSLVERVG